MIHIMQTIKKLTGILLIPVFFLLINCNHKPKYAELKLTVVEVENGWGYKIDVNDTTLIYQPTIPGIYGNKPFHSKEDAKKIGEIVLRKLSKRQIPSISEEELIKNGIINK